MFYRGIDAILNTAIENRQSNNTDEKRTGKKIATGSGEEKLIPPLPPTRSKVHPRLPSSTTSSATASIGPATSPLQAVQSPSSNNSTSTAVTAHERQPCNVRESELRIKKALSEIVSAAKDRSEALKANQCRNTDYDGKDAIFSNLKCSMEGPAAIIGNNVVRASKRSEVDTAIKELEVKRKCDIIYGETECLRFFHEHTAVLLQMAMQSFSRTNTAKCSGLNVNVKGGANQFTNRVTVKHNKPPISCDGRDATCRNGISPPRVTVFEIKGVPKRTIEKNFMPSSSSPSDRLKPSDRINLDTTKAEASHVFSTLRRLDVRRPLYFAGRTFYQRKPTLNNSFRWTEVVGWDETAASRETVKAINPTVEDLFVLPASFKKITVKLMEKYKHFLLKNSTARGKNKRSYYKVREVPLNPQVDSAIEYKTVIDKFNCCLDTLLSLGKNNTYTKLTVEQYRGKFRRYLVFCFAFYALNCDKHSDAVTPLPFNFLNLFAFMYCHGRDLNSSSFLATLTFLQNHVFNPMSTAAPAVSAKRLLDIDFAVMRGGKAAGVRDFGSPVKTSLHTRTLVSFLGFAEMTMGVMSGLLLSPSRLSQTLRCKVTKSLERWCDAIIFVFFTFVLFHRFSAVKKVTLEAALRLVMGQTHAHTNKVRAAKRIRLSKNDQTEPAEEEEIRCFKREDFTEDDIDVSGITLSHPHLLGLPYAMQAALGIQVSKINPIMTADSGGVNNEYGKKYRLGSLLGATKDLGRNFPGAGEAAGNLGMFENLVKEMIDDYYGDGSFGGIIRSAMEVMQDHAPYDVSSCLISPPRFLSMPYDEKRNKGGRTTKYAMNRDVEEYLMASPMRMVFVKVFDSELAERYLSVGDLAVLAIWVKSHVLSLPWDAPAVGRSQYDWIGSTVCKNLLLSDLTNFGTWGDLKLVNKLDMHTKTFHRDNERFPTAKDKKKFVENTSLDDRKSLAILHSCINVRTRTHLGRVTSTSWAVDALRTFTKGDKHMFASLAVSLDSYHLGHSNAANFVPYFNNNCSSNEQEMGLWGFVRRTSEKVAKEELAKGRLGNLHEVGIAKANLAAAAVAISSAVDIGEEQAVLDDGAKSRLAVAAVSSNRVSTSMARERLRAKGLKRLLDKSSQPKTGNIFHLKDLWGYFSSPYMRQNLLEGKPVSALCSHTGFLNAAVPDCMIAYHFEGPTSCIKLRMELLPSLRESCCGVKRPADESASSSACGSGNNKADAHKRKRLVNNEDAVISLDTDITAYDKFNLAETEEARQRLVEQDKQCRLAAGIRKVCTRQKTDATRRSLVKYKNRDANEADDERILQDLNSLAYLA